MTPGLLNEPLRGSLSTLVTQRLGLRFPPDRWDELERGVRGAARALGAADVRAWAEALLIGEPTFAQMQALANELTIGETYFFRQAEVFRALREDVIPDLVRRRTGADRRIAIWSAACSTGEEPYSIAIALHETLPEPAAWQIRLLATDINSTAIARATQAVYSDWSFRDAPPWLKPRYFTRRPDRRHELRRPVRDLVRFGLVNLTDPRLPEHPGGWDILFCRNALMYFSAEWQAVILERFADALAPEGLLVLGPCDTTATVAARFEPRPGLPNLFRKRSSRRRPPATVESPPPAPAPPLWTVLVAPPGADTASTPPEAAPADVIPEPPPPPPVPLPSPPAPAAERLDCAMQAADRGSLDAALAECDGALAANKLDARAHFLRGCILTERGEPERAAESFRRVLFLEPDFLFAHLELGWGARKGGRPREAARHFRAAADLLADHPRGAHVPGSGGLTAARLQAVVKDELDQLLTAGGPV